MSVNRCPETFWDFALEYRISIRQFLVRRAADERSPIETVTGDTPDISEYIDFDFYEFVKYRDATADRDDPIKLGQWLGIAHEIRTAMTYWILKGNGQVICCSTVRPLLKEEWINETEKAAQVSFDETIKEKYGNYDTELLEIFENEDIINPSSLDEEPENDAQPEMMDRQNKKRKAQHEVQNDIVRGPDLFQDTEIIYPHGDCNEIAKVVG
jgi:hypothetical protein